MCEIYYKPCKGHKWRFKEGVILGFVKKVIWKCRKCDIENIENVSKSVKKLKKCNKH